MLVFRNKKENGKKGNQISAGPNFHLAASRQQPPTSTHALRPAWLSASTLGACWSVTPSRQRRVTLIAGARKLVCSADHFSSTWAQASSARYTGMWARPLRCVNHLANGARSGADLPDSADPPLAELYHENNV
jgi:hypothetical protein